MTKTAIIWFRQDLRINDNPAFAYALENFDSILGLYIHDKKPRESGGASKWFLHYTLENFSNSLKNSHKVDLIFKKGDSEKILEKVINEVNPDGVFWNRIYEPENIKRDKKIKETIKKAEIDVKSFNGSLLVEPWQIKNGSGEYYKVFTSFYKKAISDHKPREIIENSKKQSKSLRTNITSLKLEELNLLPQKPDWSKKMLDYWNFGEEAAAENLDEFLNGKVSDYKNNRDIPSIEGTSKLSPYLHFGVISPHQIFHKAENLKNSEKFISEIYWREFSYNLMFNFEKMDQENFRPEFDNFPWQNNKEFLHKWQSGNTGYPIVDAGMRELWETGWMHNRVRMIVGSFLTKHLLTHWKAGEKWFWDTLVDASPANNTASWQWIAGCGADAAPYFRIFNPVKQGEKFDPDGDYVKRWVPELYELPKEFIHKPWEADENILEAANLELGNDYPYPIVNHSMAREAALKAYQKMKN